MSESVGDDALVGGSSRRRWRTRLELANAIFEYVEVFPQPPTPPQRPSNAHTNRIRGKPPRNTNVKLWTRRAVDSKLTTALGQPLRVAHMTTRPTLTNQQRLPRDSRPPTSRNQGHTMSTKAGALQWAEQELLDPPAAKRTVERLEVELAELVPAIMALRAR
jgi:hypothetical protein